LKTPASPGFFISGKHEKKLDGTFSKNYTRCSAGYAALENVACDQKLDGKWPKRQQQ